MTVDCVVYISSVANARKHTRKIACLENFARGVKAQGKTVIVDWNYQYQPSHLAVMLGWATTNTGGQNITLRKQVIAEQQRHGFKTMCIDASCFKYLDDQGTYLRYSLGGPFYDRAEYANAHSTPDKWQEIQQRLGITLRPPRTSGDYVLIGMQRDGGFAMKTLSPMSWLQQKITDIRKHTRRPIVIRPHPGQYDMQNFAIYTGKDAVRNNVRVIDPKNSRLVDDLQQAHAAVFFNSSASVATVLEGIPTFVDDMSAVTWQVAHHDVANIESPQQFDRTQWIHNLSAAHWSDLDGSSGRIYQKFLNYL